MGSFVLLLAASLGSSFVQVGEISPRADTVVTASAPSASPASGGPQPAGMDPASSTAAAAGEAASHAERPPAVPAVPAVQVGEGTLLVNGFMQTAYVGATGAHGGFRVRAAELTFSGQVTPRARWLVKFDAAKGLSLQADQDVLEGSPVLTGVQVNQRSRILQDAFLTLDLGHLGSGLSLVAGQGKLPLGQDHAYAPSNLPTLERARFLSDGARGGLGVVRDVGVMLRGRAGEPVRWQVGLWNGMGEGMNRPAGDGRRAAAGRLTVAVPRVPGLELGGTGAADVEAPEGLARRRITGADLRWRHAGWMAAGELLRIDLGPVTREGWYLHLDHRTAPGLRPFGRIEGWNPDLSQDGSPASAAESRWMLGATHYFSGENVKLEGAFARSSFAGAFPTRNTLILNLQLMW